VTYNAASRKDVRRLEKQARVEERQRLDTIRVLMSTTAGRQWVYDRLSQCHVFASSFSLNAYESAFKEGERNVGLQILNDVMMASPDNYVLMMREANVRHIAADSSAAGAADAERPGGEDGDWGDQGPDPDDAA
jgi:hypothetical protein